MAVETGVVTKAARSRSLRERSFSIAESLAANSLASRVARS